MSRGLLRNTGILAAFTALSRVLGLLREQTFFALFGAGHAALSDAFLTAYTIPNLFRGLFAEGALSAAFVTTFAGVAEKESPERAWALANRLITALALSVGGFVLFGVLATPTFVALIAPGYADIPGKVALAERLTRLLWPFLLIVSLASIWMGMLNARERFAVSAAAPVMFNVGSLLVGVPLAFLFDPALGPRALVGFAIGVLTGGVLQWLIQVPAVHREGFRFRPDFRFRDPGFRRIMRLMAPAVIGVAAVQINVLVNQRFASTMGNGPVAWLYSAFRLIQLPIGVFGVAVGTATLPALSRAAAMDETDLFRTTLSRGLRLVALLCIPSAVGLAILAEPIIGIIYEHRQFGPRDTLMAAQALRFYAIGLAAYAAIKVLAPALYALGDARRPALVSAFSVLVNYATGWTLTQRLGVGHWGLALSVSAVATANFLLLLWAIRRHIGAIDEGMLLREVGKIVVAAGLMAAVCGGTVVGLSMLFGDVATAFLPRVVIVGVAIGVSVGTFWTVGRRLHIEDMDEVVARLTARFLPPADSA